MSGNRNLPPVEFTGTTSESILQDMVASIPALTNKWTDLNPTDVGVVILELLSWSQELLLYYLDRSANEAFLVTARERRNVMNLCKLIGYKLDGVVSSTTILEFTIEEASGARIEIPAYTQCAASGASTLRFATTERITIPAGQASAIVGARQGTVKTESFASDGEPSQRYKLAETLADHSSIRVVVDGVIWAEVDSFVNSQAGDKHFVVEIDHEDNVYVVLGDGFFGQAPVLSQFQNIQITYLVSSGASGNIGSGSISTILDDMVDVNGDSVSLSVTNIQAATGGSDRETIEHAKIQAPAELAALFRAMTKSDFITLSEGFPGVSKANAWGEQESDPPDYNLFNWVMVVCAPDGVTREALVEDVANGLPSEQLKSDLIEFLKSRACITTRMKVIDPGYIPISLSIRVYHAKGFLPSNVRSGVEEAILDFFSFENVSFGKEIRKSNVIRVADNVPGVEYIEIDALNIDDNLESGILDTIVVHLYELPFLRQFSLTISEAVGIPEPANEYPCP